MMQLSVIIRKGSQSIKDFTLFDRVEWQAWIVLGYAIFVMIAMQIIYPFYHPPLGDSDMDFMQARSILGWPGGQSISSHSPGMALFLILTGTLHLGTWRILIALYSLMSVAMSYMVYGIVKPYSRNWGLITALLAISGGTLFVYSRIDSYDHLFLFFEFLSFYLISLYFNSPAKHPRLPYLIALVFLCMNLIKPISTLLFWVFVCFALFVPNGQRKKLMGCVLLYIGLMGVWVCLDRDHCNGNFPEWKPPGKLRERFAESYYMNKMPLKEQDGPATQALYTALRAYIATHVPLWSHPVTTKEIAAIYPHKLFAKYKTQPEVLLNAIFNNQNTFYFNFIVDAANAYWGKKEAVKKLSAVAGEHGNLGLQGYLKYFYLNSSKIITGPLVSMGWRNLLAIYTFVPLRNLQNWNILLDNPLPNMVKPINGPYSQKFFNEIHFFIQALPLYWEHANLIFEKFTGRPTVLYQAILNMGNPTMPLNKRIGGEATIVEGWYYTAFMGIYGAKITNALYKNVVMETLNNYPNTLLLFVDNFFNEIFFYHRYPAVGRISLDFLSMSEINFAVRDNYSKSITDSLYRELQPKIYGTKMTRLMAVIYEVMHRVSPLFFILACFVFISALRKAGVLALYLAAAYFYFVLVFSVFGNFGSDRYSDIFILLPLIVTALGCAGLPQIFSRK